MNHIVIAVPAYTWQVHISTMRSIITDLLALVARGDRVSIFDESGSSDLADARAIIVAHFLNGDGTHLISLDNDVCWQAGALVRLVDAPVDMVAGVYPKRQDPIEFPLRYLDRPELWSDPKTGLLEVEAVQGGFVRYSRACLERMVEAYADLRCLSSRSPLGHLYALFDPLRLPDGRKLGEDFAFCHRWRAIGGEVWIDPEFKMGHTGLKLFAGSLGDHLRQAMKAAA